MNRPYTVTGQNGPRSVPPLRREDPVDIFGVRVMPWEGEGLIRAMIASATGETRRHDTPLTTVHYANVHVLNTAYRNGQLHRQLGRASTVYCDGSGVRFGAALLGGRLPPRITAADWIDSFCSRAAGEGVRLFFIAGADEVALRAAAILQSRHPGLMIVGTHHGFVDETSSPQVVDRVNESGADIVLVGMGTPLQELWVARFREAIKAPVVWTVGALFDFVAGTQRRAPGWLRDHHMEWLWRLATAPGRLGARYLLGNPVFLLRILIHRVRGSRRT